MDKAVVVPVIVALCITIVAVTALLMGIDGTITLSAFAGLGGIIGITGKIAYDKLKQK